jgi:hypothetical protein
MVDFKSISELVKNNAVTIILGIVAGVASIRGTIRELIPYPYVRDLIIISALTYVFLHVLVSHFAGPIIRKYREYRLIFPRSHLWQLLRDKYWSIIWSVLLLLIFPLFLYSYFAKTFGHMPVPREWNRCFRLPAECRSNCPAAVDATGETVGLDCIGFSDDAGKFRLMASQILYYEPSKLRVTCNGETKTHEIPRNGGITQCDMLGY